MTVLVIDSDHENLRSMVDRLRRAGFDTLGAMSGEEAILLLGTTPDIAFVFAHPGAVVGPGMEALEPLIRMRRPDIAILPSQTVDDIMRNVVPFVRRRGCGTAGIQGPAAG